MESIKGGFWVKNEIANFDEKTLKGEFTDAEYSQVYEKLFRQFHGKKLSDTRGCKKLIWNYEDFDFFFGLAYASSGLYAGFWVCNVEFDTLPGYHLQVFALDNERNIIAMAWDNEENEKFFNLGKLN